MKKTEMQTNKTQTDEAQTDKINDSESDPLT